MKIFRGIPFHFSYQDPATALYPYQPLPFTTQLGSSNDVITVDPHLKLPVTYQWNAALEREFGPQSLTVTYVGAYGNRLLYSTSMPLQSQGITFYDTPTWNAGSSHYNTLQVKLMRRMMHGLQALASYSYSRSNDVSSDDYNSFGAPSAVSVLSNCHRLLLRTLTVTMFFRPRFPMRFPNWNGEEK